jgi:hypothetical protein
MEGKSSIEYSWVSFSCIIYQVRASQLVAIRNAARDSKERDYGWEGGAKKEARLMVKRD